MKDLFVRFVREEDGQDIIEYALLATLISIVAALAAQTLGANLSAWYTAMAAYITTLTGLVPAA